MTALQWPKHLQTVNLVGLTGPAAIWCDMKSCVIGTPVTTWVMAQLMFKWVAYHSVSGNILKNKVAKGGDKLNNNKS